MLSLCVMMLRYQVIETHKTTDRQDSNAQAAVSRKQTSFFTVAIVYVTSLGNTVYDTKTVLDKMCLTESYMA